MKRHQFSLLALLAAPILLAACHPEVDDAQPYPAAVHEAPQHQPDILAPRN